MLSRLHRAIAPVSVRATRSFGKRSECGTSTRAFSTALAKAAPEYKTVPFVHEDVEQVMQEVPPFSYYHFGDPMDNPYKLMGLDQPILDPSEIQTPTLTEPKLQFSKLENGLRIASVDRGGLTCSLGLFINAGARHEDSSNFGVTHMVEQMAYKSTAHLSFLRQMRTIENLGANVVTTAGREHLVYQAECQRAHMPILAPLIIGNVLFPRYLPWEIKDVKEHFTKVREELDKNADANVTELLHQAAYHNNTLGHKIYATDRSLNYFDDVTIRKFVVDNFSADRMVFVGVNVDHNELTKWLMRSFVDYTVIKPKEGYKQKAPIYSGGDARMAAALPQLHLAIGFETGGWNSADLVPATLLQTILGGGGSFSTGGPGKGMHTRLFTEVLNKCEFTETAMAFNSMYSDSGLFGIYLVGEPQRGGDLVEIAKKQFSNLGKVSDDELKKAKNSLKSSVLMNLECRNVILEDVARQMLMSNKVVTGREFCAAIDACTAKDIEQCAARLLSKRPSVAAYGDIVGLPNYDEIAKKLK